MSKSTRHAQPLTRVAKTAAVLEVWIEAMRRDGRCVHV
jgi:hypothetical protein